MDQRVQQALRLYRVDTSRGPVCFFGDSPSPAALMFHGFKRQPQRAWLDLFPGAAFGLLPGFGRAPALASASVPEWAAAWREALRQLGSVRSLIGESLGALLAMSLPAERTVAIEPLLSVEHIWPQHIALKRLAERGEMRPEWAELFDTPYDWVLGRIAAPTLLLAGKNPLLPPRFTPLVPSLLTDEDFNRYAAHPLVTALRIDGGHTLIDENPETVARLTADFLS